MLSLLTAAILGLCAAGILYGVNIILATICVAVLCKHGLKSSNMFLVALIVIQLALCTGQLISILSQVITGFVHPPPTRLPIGTATDAYFIDQRAPEHVVQLAFASFNSIVSDAFITWRVYVVWDKKLALAIPFAMLNIIGFVSVSLQVKVLSVVSPEDVFAFFTGNVRRCTLTFLFTSIITQASGTFLIAWRGWATPTAISSAGKGSRCSFLRILGIAIDSGAVYMSLIALVMALYLTESSVGLPVSSILGQFSATVTLSIILREWWKLIQAKARGTLIPRNRILADQYELPQRSISPVLRGEITTDDNNMFVRVVTSTHKKIDTERSLSGNEYRFDHKPHNETVSSL